VEYTPAGTAVLSFVYAGISTTDALIGGMGSYAGTRATHSAGSGSTIPTPTMRLSLAATTTVYLVSNQGFSTSTCTASGVIRARRLVQ
jgi:hypothetical protein